MTDTPNYVSSWIHGGLGNQLFQIASALEYAKKYKKTPIFKDEKRLWHPFNFERITGWDTIFNNNLKVIEPEKYDKIDFNIYHEEVKNNYNELPYIQNNVYLKGYFQAAKYISPETRTKMNELIYSNPHYYQSAKDEYQKIKSFFNDENDDNYVFMHFRRTDYINNPYHPTLDFNYYNNGLRYFNNNINIIIFSDDINWCKNVIKINDKKIYYVDINDIFKEMILMTFIKNGIIANSTFSWWGAFLGDENKKIIAPKLWFNLTCEIKKWSDIYCDNWIVIY